MKKRTGIGILSPYPPLILPPLSSLVGRRRRQTILYIWTVANPDTIALMRVGVQLDRSLVFHSSLVQLVLLLEDITEAVMRISVLWIELDRQLVLPSGLVQLVLLL